MEYAQPAIILFGIFCGAIAGWTAVSMVAKLAAQTGDGIGWRAVIEVLALAAAIGSIALSGSFFPLWAFIGAVVGTVVGELIGQILARAIARSR